MRRWLACGILLGFVLSVLPGCGDKEPAKHTEQLPPGRVPQDPKTKK